MIRNYTAFPHTISSKYVTEGCDQMGNNNPKGTKKIEACKKEEVVMREGGREDGGAS